MNKILGSLLESSPLMKIDPKTQLSEWATTKLTKGVASNIASLIGRNKELADALYSISKMMKNIDISIIEEIDKVEVSIFKFPIVPATINFGANNVEESVDTIAGKINYLKDLDFHMISFSSFFPSVYYPFSKSYKQFGVSYVNQLERLKISKKPLKLVITGIGFVQDVYITKFVYNTSSSGDIEYSIEFKEARTPSIYETNAKEFSFKPKTFELSR